MEAELYLLAPGRYTVEVRASVLQTQVGKGAADGMDRIAGPTGLEVTGPRTRIALQVPSRRRTVLCVRRSD